MNDNKSIPVTEAAIDLSIIIPLYNGAETIERALRSIYSQDIPDERFEVIVVNDGSTDGSEQLVARWAQRHPNLSIINQANSGPGAARNAGLAQARGQYIGFLDADDYYAGKHIERLLEIARENDAEIVIYETREINEADVEKDLATSADDNAFSERVSPVMTGVETEDKAGKAGFLFCCNYFLVKRELYERLGIRFDTTIYYGEDTIVSVTLLLHAERVVTTNILAHRYVLRPDGLCRSRDNEKKTRRVRSYKAFVIAINRINEDHSGRKSRGYLLHRRRTALFTFFYLYGTFANPISTRELRDAIKELRQEHIYPLCSFEDFGYSGLRHRLMLWLCNHEHLFLALHRLHAWLKRITGGSR